MTAPRRWYTLPFLVACMIAFFPAAWLSWFVVGNQPNAETQIIYGWVLGWGNAILATIINRFVFSDNSYAFIVWVFVGKGVRMILFIFALAFIGMSLPGDASVFVGTAFAAYFLFLFIEIFCFYLFSQRVDRQPTAPISQDSAQAE